MSDESGNYRNFEHRAVIKFLVEKGNTPKDIYEEMSSTECSIRNNPGSIYAFDFGTVRRKPQKIEKTYKKVSEVPNIPRVTFVTGKRLQTVDFG